MKRFSYVVYTVVFMLFGLTASAQNEAKNLLDKASEKIKNMKSVEVIFSLTMENKAENISEVHDGKAYMKGNMYRLDIMGVENYYDGKIIYQYMPEVKEVNLKSPSDSEEEMLNPTKMFNVYNDGFQQKVLKKEGNLAVVELVPTSKDNNVVRIIIEMNVQTSALQKVTYVGKDGCDLILSIKKLSEPAQSLHDSFFSFDTKAHSDVEVVDMR